MEVAAGLIELKPDSLEQVETWAKTINERLDEALATLQDEGVELESWFHISLAEKDYLLFYMRTESLQQAHETAEQSQHDIDAFHQTFKKTWLGSTRAKLLVDLVNDET